MTTYGQGRRVAIVAGVRTPFARAGSTFRSLSAIELGKHAVTELLYRTALDPASVDLLVFGTVIPSVLAPNIAREISLMPLLPKGIQSYSVSRACASVPNPPRVRCPRLTCCVWLT
jgi:acetyl-CoA acyltransferase